MKASQLIQELQAAIDKKGDCEVKLLYDSDLGRGKIKEVIIEEWEGVNFFSIRENGDQYQ